MQAIDGNVEPARLGQHRLARPIVERIELEHAAAGVEAGQSAVAPVFILVGAQPGDPGRRPGKRAVERPRLAHVATSGARLLRLVKAVDTLLGDQPLQRRAIGVDRANAAAVAALRLRPQRVGFRKQPSGIERHHVDVEIAFADPVEDELALDAEAVGEDNGAVDLAAQIDQALGWRQCRHVFAANSSNRIQHAAPNERGNGEVKPEIEFAYFAGHAQTMLPHSR